MHYLKWPPQILIMKYRARITIKNGILDNAGNAVTHALNILNFGDVSNVRIGKLLEIELDGDDWEKADAICKSQTNEVMEDYFLEKIE